MNLLRRIHDKRPPLHDRLADRLAGNDQQTGFSAGLDDKVARKTQAREAPRLYLVSIGADPKLTFVDIYKRRMTLWDAD